MKEIDFYPQFSEIFLKYLRSYLPKEIQIGYSYNKSLDTMLEDLGKQFNIPINFENEYVPKLKLDILFAFKKNNKYELLLFEVKYLHQLALQDYSQLSGYLQVAKHIPIGILLLITKGISPNKLSNDFNEIIRLENLSMDWSQFQTINSTSFAFKTGIMLYQPKGAIEWYNTNKILGISDFESLAKLIVLKLKNEKTT